MHKAVPGEPDEPECLRQIVRRIEVQTELREIHAERKHIQICLSHTYAASSFEAFTCGKLSRDSRQKAAVLEVCARFCSKLCTCTP